MYRHPRIPGLCIIALIIALLMLPQILTASPTPSAGFQEAADTVERPPPVRAVTHGPKFHWFGYYDVLQFDPTQRYLLAMAVDFEHRSPEASDVIEIGMIDLDDGDRWIPLGASRAWCWQQGCRLQWRPGSMTEVLWNDREDGRFVCRILDVKTGAQRAFPHPVYHVSPDGRNALGTDFARINHMRPGYGYAGVADQNREVPAPEESGIYLLNLDTGACRTLFSIAEVAALPYPGQQDGDRHYFNHIMWNPDGTRFLFLHRWRPAGGGGFRTRMFTADAEGGDLRLVTDRPAISHYTWRDRSHILIHRGAYRLYLDDGRGKETTVLEAPNGHQTYLPDRAWLLTDTYPQGPDREQHVYLFHIPTGTKITLGRFPSPRAYGGEWRVDTHPRISPDSTKVVIDSAHGGNGRQIYLIEIGDLLAGDIHGDPPAPSAGETETLPGPAAVQTGPEGAGPAVTGLAEAGEAPIRLPLEPAPRAGSPTKTILTPWERPDDRSGTPFHLGAGKGAFHAWGRRGSELRAFFPEFLPALFERTLVLDPLDPGAKLVWIFTGELGGITVTINPEKVSLQQRFYDSPAFNVLNGKTPRHPEWSAPAVCAGYGGSLQAVTVKMDHRLGLEVSLNGARVLHQECFFEVSRHQLRLVETRGEARDAAQGAARGETGIEARDETRQGALEVRGELLAPEPEWVDVRVDPALIRQTMVGFGGIATPTAYARLSAAGKRRWWELLCAYNLLIQREYPMGQALAPSMDNWDRLGDATPHYYGDNFPNGEVSDFAYLKTLRRLGGKVWFEFWALPPWVGGDPGKYAEAMVRYCEISKARSGAPPDVVGIQNEVSQTEAMFHAMTLGLRRALDAAGFAGVRIHMSDHGGLRGGIERAKLFLSSEAVWDAIDFSATHMYDYQSCFTGPDRFDPLLAEWKGLTGEKPFLSTELCINSGTYQWPTYRMALAMGQLYHKNLVLADAAAICYCWTLLNVEQPSYGWTRTLFVPDRAGGHVPAPSSSQLRVFGAYSRRIREGMTRVEATSGNPDLLVSAFAGEGGRATLVVLNRSTRPVRARIHWRDARFREMEITDPYHANEVFHASEVLNANKILEAPVPQREPETKPGQQEPVREGGAAAIVAAVPPGALVTLTNVPLGTLPEGFQLEEER